MKIWGDDIVSLFDSAKYSAWIVAPFMRSDALSRLLDSISDGVEIIVVTRWRPADILSGVSDLDIYDVAESKGAALYIRHDLHAKYFAADDRCLIGSANVTLTALGWRKPANLELLTPVSRSSDHLVEFEQTLLSDTIRANAAQRDSLKELISQIRKINIPIPNVEDKKWKPLPKNWIPYARNPEEMYSVYIKNDDVGRTTRKDLQQEIDRIGVISGLDEQNFRMWIASKISQVPLIIQVNRHIEKHGHVTEDALDDLLTQIDGDEKKPVAREVLEVLQRWLTYFLQTEYQTAPDAIKLIRAKKI